MVAMAKTRTVSYDEFTSDLDRLLEAVAKGETSVEVVRPDGTRIVLRRRLERRKTTRRARKTSADRAAFLASAGAWHGLVDADRLVSDIRASRDISTRPPIEL